MKKTMNVHLAGQLFRVDEEAFHSLSRYLEKITARFRDEPGGEETVADIESRIAELFGGGQEPPLLVTRVMVDHMIEVMGAPEEYAGGDAAGEAPAPGQPLFHPKALLSRAGKMLWHAWKALRPLLALLLRIVALLLGIGFTLVGFSLLFTFGLVLFFNHSPLLTGLIEPHIVNPPMLLSLVLSPELVRPVFILSVLALLIPLAVLTYLGIKLIFRLGAITRLVKIPVFVLWTASVCGLVVFLAFQLSAYGNRAQVAEKTAIATPLKTLWIAPLKKIAAVDYDESAVFDDLTFRRKGSSGPLYGTADLNIYGSDTTTAWISVEKWARSSSQEGAWANARKIGFRWKVSRDTLYLDEYFTLPAGSPWHGSSVEIEVGLPEGTEIRPVAGAALPVWRFRSDAPEVKRFQIREGQVEEISNNVSPAASRLPAAAGRVSRSFR